LEEFSLASVITDFSITFRNISAHGGCDSFPVYCNGSEPLNSQHPRRFLLNN
ncbi:hypothetical protein J6590_004705, partial [Homalodisca vitripennis]